MKNHQLKALVQVAESGSIRAAARVMNLCQSALTKSLRELEEETGYRAGRVEYVMSGPTSAGMSTASGSGSGTRTPGFNARVKNASKCS